MGLYPNGIKDLLNEEKPKESEPQIILFFNAPLWFCQKYGVKQKEDDKLSLKNVIKGVEEIFKLGVNTIGLNLDFKKDKNLLFKENESSSGLELDEYGINNDENKIEEEINNSIELTDYVRDIIFNIFENFDTLSEELILILLEKYENEKGLKLKEKNPVRYKKINEMFKKIKMDPDEDYTTLNYEDLILIIAKVVKFYTKLNVNLQFTFLEKTVIMSFWGREKQIDSLAEAMKYELKVKDYALKFQKIFNMVKDSKKGKETKNEIIYNYGSKGVDDDRDILIGKDWIPLKFHNIHVKNVLDFSPTMKYNPFKEEKYQRYEPDDEYHECNVAFDSDEICDKGCSKYRNIDKLRIIYNYIDQLLKIKCLTNKKVLNYILIKRNHVDYHSKLNADNLILRPFNIYNVGATNDFIYTVRNFYGEEIAYYFLWLTNYIKWLVFPSILGIIFEAAYRRVNQKEAAHNPILSLISCAFFILWGKAFIYHWQQKEQLYNYIWGTENYKKAQLFQESFVPDGYIPLLMGQKAPYVNKFKRNFRIFVSYIFIFFMMCIVFGLVTIIFKIKALLINKFPTRTTEIGVLIGIALFSMM